MIRALCMTAFGLAVLSCVRQSATKPPLGADSALGEPAAWFMGSREVDLTNDGKLDLVVLRATGEESNALRVVLTLVVAGEERWREEWHSSYDLTDPPEFATSLQRDEYVRTALSRALASVRAEPFDLSSYRMMVNPIDSALLRSPPDQEVVLSYGYESTVVLRWNADRGTFEILHECC